MENMIDLKGKNVLVTGGSQGIGAAICRVMAACGANVLINFHKARDKAASLKDDLSNQYGTRVELFQADIAKPAEVAAMFAFADSSLGPIDVLVNNAGFETIEHAIDLNLSDWDRVMDVDLKGAFVCAREAARRMITRGAGVVLNISSIHDKVPRKGLVHYCSAKAGLAMMSKCLALEWAEFNIRVLCLSPGAIETEMNREEIEKFGREKFNNWIPGGRIGTVDDVAWTCAFMACDRAAYITGTEIYIDGAYKESTIPYDPRPQRNKNEQ